MYPPRSQGTAEILSNGIVTRSGIAELLLSVVLFGICICCLVEQFCCVGCRMMLIFHLENGWGLQTVWTVPCFDSAVHGVWRMNSQVADVAVIHAIGSRNVKKVVGNDHVWRVEQVLVTHNLVNGWSDQLDVVKVWSKSSGFWSTHHPSQQFCGLGSVRQLLPTG